MAFISYPMIIPGSISVIGMDMMWDPDTDSQSLSMSGFSCMIQQKLYQDKVFLAPPILSCIEARKRLKENNLTWNF